MNEFQKIILEQDIKTDNIKTIHKVLEYLELISKSDISFNRKIYYINCLETARNKIKISNDEVQLIQKVINYTKEIYSF